MPPGPFQREQTYCSNAEVFIDVGSELEFYAKERCHQYLAKKVQDATPRDESTCSETITHALIGDITECLKKAGSMSAEDPDLFAPKCGRSGRDVKVILCPIDGEAKEVGVFARLASDENSRPDDEGVLVVKKVLLSNEVDEQKWSDVFRRSFYSKCVDDSPSNDSNPST